MEGVDAVENCGNLEMPRAEETVALLACSACAGDYEDPDRTAWSDDRGDGDDETEIAGDVVKTVSKASLRKNTAVEKAGDFTKEDGRTECEQDKK
jgi:hypothetical protein